MTDLVAAQRTSAWADVARRIAHEIKNPLTPDPAFGGAAEAQIWQGDHADKEVFDQCTDTIIRQVDDIKRMVDEFSSFSRMPKAQLAPDDLGACIEQVLFLMRVGHPEIDIAGAYPPEPQILRFDRRLVSQALTNVVKNAAEGIAATEMDGRAPKIAVSCASRTAWRSSTSRTMARGSPRKTGRGCWSPT